MPKLVDTPKPAPTRLELARQHLNDLKRRVAEMDAKGAELLAELECVNDRIPEAALDAIADQGKAEALTALRARKDAIPGEIDALKAARSRHDADLAEGEAALRQAQIEEAAIAAVDLTAEREHQAAEIDAALAKLGTAWSAYTAGGKKLRGALETLGIDPAGIAKHDRVRLTGAVRAVDHNLALAVGQSPPTRACVGSMRIVEDFGLWRNSRSMVDGDDSEEARELLAAAAGVELAA